MSAQPTQKPVCAVVGVGPGNGAAFARRFAAEGYAVALLARTTSLTSRLAQELPLARAYACDAGDPATVERTFEAIESDLGSVDVLIYNAGKGVWGSAEEVTFEDFEAAWRTNTFGAFAAARSVIPAMKRRAAGHIIPISALTVGELSATAVSRPKFACDGRPEHFAQLCRTPWTESGFKSRLSL
jgi:NAD(P)-dependent dehydrogenase (short-subunit alcohol dehydrogenase family)